MDNLKTYETFDGSIGLDQDDEERIDKVIELLLKKKEMISMLGDTINYVSKQIQQTLPLQIGEFMEDLYHYDDEAFEIIDHIKEKLIDGYPNVKDLIEDIEKEFNSLQNYMKLKKM